MARGQSGLRGGHVLCRVEWVSSPGTGSAWACSLLKAPPVLVLTERTACADQPRVTVGFLSI